MTTGYISLRVPGEQDDIVTNAHPFFATQGRCYVGIADQVYDAYVAALEEVNERQELWGATVLIVSQEGDRLYGWYKRSFVYPEPQYLATAERQYIASCAVSDARLLKAAHSPVLPADLQNPQWVYFLSKPQVRSAEQLIRSCEEKAQFVPLQFHEGAWTQSYQKRGADIHALIKRYEQSGDVRLLYRLLAQVDTATCNDVQQLDLAGYSLMELARPQEALALFERILQLEPEHRQAALDKGKCLMRLGETQSAANWLRHSLSLHADDELKLELALAYGRLNYESAAQQLLKSIREQPWASVAANWLRDERGWTTAHGTDGAGGGLQPFPILMDYEGVDAPQPIRDSVGRTCYLDVVRGKPLLVTPEETVRQQLIAYMLMRMQIPKEAIFVEESLTRHDRSLLDRVDILVLAPDGSNLMLVECKAPLVPLHGDPTRQLVRYSKVVKAPYIMLCNGAEAHAYQHNRLSGVFEALSEIPSYVAMQGDGARGWVPPLATDWKRPGMKDLASKEYQDFAVWHGMLGEQTPHTLRAAVLNLAHCLLDESHVVSSEVNIPGYSLATDHGCVYLRFGNASGGGYPGRYRWISAVDEDGNLRNAYFAVFSAGSYTSLVCGVEERGSVVSRLQVRLDKCLVPQGDSHRLTHDARSAGGTVAGLMAYVQQNSPDLLGTQERVFLGHLNTSKLLRLSDEQTADTILRLFRYLLLRSHMRQIST